MPDKNEIKTPSFIKSLVKANGKTSGRKVWSVDLETVWIPFFTATNTMGDTAIPLDSIGCPLRLQYEKDGSVRFSTSGKPVIRVDKELNKAITLVRENFVAGLQDYANTIATSESTTEAYRNTVTEALKAGKPISLHDKAKLEEAMLKAVQAGIDHAEAEAKTEEEAEAKTEEEAERILEPV